MTKMQYFDRDGQPLTIMQWSVLFGDHDYKVIVSDEITGCGTLSTVWLGLDHNSISPDPHIFETMYFPHGQDGDHEKERCERYSTERQARKGHARLLKELTGHSGKRRSH